MKSSLFILGSTRSGTSALRNAIAETRYKGAGEGHSIGLLGALHDTIDAYFREHQEALGQGTMLAEWQRDEFWNDIVIAYLAQLRRVFPGDYYLDKTPTIGPVQYLDIIQSYLPAPSIIFCRRRGIDNVLSKARKWPETSFSTHCEEWRDVLNLWDDRKVALQCPWMEIEFDMLWESPASVAAQTGSFLSLSDNETFQVEQSLSQGNSKGIRQGSAVSIDETGWTDDEKALFMATCGSTMERCGYGYYTYWRTIPAAR